MKLLRLLGKTRDDEGSKLGPSLAWLPRSDHAHLMPERSIVLQRLDG